MAESVTWGLGLDGSQAVASAEQVATALDELNQSIKRDQQAMAEAQKAMKLLGKETSATKDHLDRLKKTVEDKQAAISSAALDVQKLGGTFKDTKKPANDFRSGLQRLGAEAKNIGGPIGQVFGRMENLSKFAGSSKAKFVLAGLGVAAIGVAAGAAALKMFEFAQSLSEARDKELRDLGGFLSLQKGVKDFQKDSLALQDIVGRIAHNSASSREEVTGVSKALIDAGISGKHLENALEAANMAQVVAGEEGVKQFIEQAKAAHQHGKSIESVATTFRTKYGPAAKAAMLGNDALAKRFKDNIASMFEGIDFKPLQEAKKRFVDLFDQSTMLGKAIGNSIKPWIQGIANFFTKTVEFARGFIVDWIIGINSIQTAYYETIIALKEFSQGLFKFGYSVGDWVERTGKKLTDWINDVKIAWQQFDAKQLGMDIVNGLLNGLKAGWESLKKGVTDLAVDIQDRFKTVLGIHSPSLVFKELGAQLPKGLELGIKSEKPAAERAIAELVPVNLDAMPQQGRAVSVTISAPITIASNGNAYDDVATLEARLSESLTRIAQQLGAQL